MCVKLMTPRSVPHDSDFKMCPSAFLPNSPPIDNPKTTRAQGQRGKVKGPQEFTALFQARTHKPLIFQAGRERSLKGTEGRSERQASGSSKLFSTHRSLNGKRIHARKSRESSSNLAHPVSEEQTEAQRTVTCPGHKATGTSIQAPEQTSAQSLHSARRASKWKWAIGNPGPV